MEIMDNVTTNPFGTTISGDDIIEALSFFDSWEDRYRYIIDLGKELPAMPEELKTEDRLVRGCQSQVWMQEFVKDKHIWLQVDSDAFIVKGLLGVVLAAYNGKTADEVLTFDIENYFNKLGLVKHLSPTRGNGLRAMVKKVTHFAKECSTVN